MDLFEMIVVETGPAAYAEPFDASSFLKMPANALVNIGYPLVAAFWIRRVLQEPEVRPGRVYFLAMAWLAFLYGFIQFARIVTQNRSFGILDQWITLPFFGLVIVWNVGLHWKGSDAVRVRTQAALMVLSITSYLLALVHPLGFEAALGIHIAAVIASSIPTLRRGGQATARPFALALICCSAFVVLKSYDHDLAALPAFQRLTGHFWSKIGDILQIHFVLRFFEAYETRVPDMRRTPLPRFAEPLAVKRARREL